MHGTATLANWLQQHMFACPSKKLLYIDCPGCGFQRSLIALIRGDILSCWSFYPPTLFIIPTLLFLILHLCFHLKHGAFILKCLYIVSAIVITANYTYKITTNHLL